MTGPCGWDVEWCDDCGALEKVSPTVRASIEAAAVRHLWTWTGRRFGACQTTVEVCARCVSGCRCVRHDAAVLPGPVAEVLAVTVNGDPQEPVEDLFRVYDHARLETVATSQGCKCKVSDEWQVTYLRGLPVPAGGELIAGVLAGELAKAICRSDDCRLPRRVQTITRQGVTVGFLDNFEGIGDGRVGLMEVDSWIATNSPHTAPATSALWSPDVDDPKFQTWPTVTVSV